MPAIRWAMPIKRDPCNGNMLHAATQMDRAVRSRCGEEGVAAWAPSVAGSSELVVRFYRPDSSCVVANFLFFVIFCIQFTKKYKVVDPYKHTETQTKMTKNT